MRLVLASQSPRRRELLIAAGVDVDVDAVDVDEARRDGETPAAYVERVARDKAAAGAARHPGRAVLGADTAVVLGEEVFGKPADTADAARMLHRLSGRDHEVLTGVALARDGRLESFVERTVVTMAPIPDADLAAYVASGEPLDKAGAYAIQGGAGRFVEGIKGSYTNVVGLPMEKVLKVLKTMGQ